jgi:hypothetical protein
MTTAQILKELKALDPEIVSALQRLVQLSDARTPSEVVSQLRRRDDTLQRLRDRILQTSAVSRIQKAVSSARKAKQTEQARADAASVRIQSLARARKAKVTANATAAQRAAQQASQRAAVVRIQSLARARKARVSAQAVAARRRVEEAKSQLDVKRRDRDRRARERRSVIARDRFQRALRAARSDGGDCDGGTTTTTGIVQLVRKLSELQLDALCPPGTKATKSTVRGSAYRLCCQHLPDEPLFQNYFRMAAIAATVLQSQPSGVAVALEWAVDKLRVVKAELDRQETRFIEGVQQAKGRIRRKLKAQEDTDALLQNAAQELARSARLAQVTGELQRLLPLLDAGRRQFEGSSAVWTASTAVTPAAPAPAPVAPRVATVRRRGRVITLAVVLVLAALTVVLHAAVVTFTLSMVEQASATTVRLTPAPGVVIPTRGTSITTKTFPISRSDYRVLPGAGSRITALEYTQRTKAEYKPDLVVSPTFLSSALVLGQYLQDTPRLA